MGGSGLFTIHLNSVVSIAVRDTMSRYGRNNLGFLWALIEPMILAVGVMVVWSIMRPPYEHGIALMMMVFTGYLPLTLWRHITQSGTGLFIHSFSLLFHRSISPADIICAKVLSEFLSTTAAALLIYFVLQVFSLVPPIERFDLVIAGWLTMTWLSIGACLFFACITSLYRETERFMQAFQYLLLPISGVFFLVEWTPDAAREMFWYVPLTHCYEMIRDGAMGSTVTTYYDAWYPLLWGAVLMAIGVLMMPRVREEMSGL
jgi:capsular polysaccharide transport system permease protein